MSILQITTDTTGQLNVNPRRVKIISTDNLATITTAGYLNPKNLQGFAIYSSDVFDIYYSWTGVTPTTGTGTYEIFTCTISQGIITLVGWSNPGDVLLPVTSGDFATFNGTTGQIKDAGYLPSNAAKTRVVMANGATIVNHIAAYADTTGTITEDVSTAINGGNIQAGLSGTAGFFTSFPATAANGSFVFKAINNSNNFAATLSNSAVGQATTYTIPDPAGATGNVAVAAAALVNNNLVKASGTAGLIADAGITAASVSGAIIQLGQLYQTSVTFNTAQMVTAYDTPLQIVANPSASQMILVHFASVYTASTGHTPYATGTAPIIQYSSGGTNGAHGAGTIATASGLVAGDITAGTSQVRNLFGIATSVLTGLSGLGIYFSNATGDYTGGTGTSVTFTVVYELLTATV